MHGAPARDTGSIEPAQHIPPNWPATARAFFYAAPFSTVNPAPGRLPHGRRNLRTGSWFVNRPPNRFVVREPPADLLSSWRTFSGCNSQTSHCPWFIKTRLSSLRPLSVIRAPLQRVSAHGARLVVACYRLPRRIGWIPARACLFPVARVRDPGQRTLARGSSTLIPSNDSNDLSRSIRESGPRGGGAMASALFRKNNPVKNDMA